ncbi:MAG: HAMP domain-containing protein [Alphaproteobacteria bacterium]|jgi:adenylate cyclase|nr:HAMP domain-containing protein [Alphaproteobacteria bacterium]
MRRSPKGLPIAIVLAGAIGAVVIIAVAIVYAAGYGVARKATADLVSERANFAIDTIISRTTQHLQPIRAQLAYINSAVDAGDVDVEDPAALGNLLSASLAAAPQVSVAAFIYPDLSVLRALRGRIAGRTAILDWSEDAEVARSYALAKAADGPFWGGLFVAEEAGQAFINLRHPVRQGGRFLGVLVAGVSVSELSMFISGIPLAVSDQAFILRGHNEVLAHPALLDGVPGISDTHPLPALHEVGDPILGALWAAENEIPLDFDIGDGLTARAVAVSGGEYVFIYRTLAGYGDVPWLVGTYVDLDAASAPLDRLGLIPRVGIAILVLGLGLALFMGSRLSRPIRQLSAAAERIRALDVDGAPELKLGRFRELNEAARAYNAMIGALRSFQTYVPRALVGRLIGQEADTAIVSEEREVTVLFTDIIGFSTLAENMSAVDLATLLNAHFTAIGQCVEAEGGTIDKYIGDSLMAFWGAPDRQSDHAARACNAARAIERALAITNQARCANGEGAVRLRIGIHSGKAVVGNIGSPSRINYTIVGDTVNIAERLEELARDEASEVANTTVLISESTAEQLEGTDIAVLPLGARQLRGRHRPIDVFQLVVDEA